MKLFRKAEIEALEKAASAAGVSYDTMMENAGQALSEEILHRMKSPAGKKAVLLCGSGNNGGDGFVCAGYMAPNGVECTVILAGSPPQTDEAKTAFERLPESVAVLSWKDSETEASAALKQADAIVDCVFGFGFHGELDKDTARLLAAANEAKCFKISADIPSGAECDTGCACEDAFRADLTVTFTARKPAHCTYPAKELCGRIEVRQVGIPKDMLESAETAVFETQTEFTRAHLNTPDAQINKGDLGRLVMVCGSYGMAGACMMAARAALRCGVGLVKIAVDHRIYPILASTVPEAVFLPLDWAAAPEESAEKLIRFMDGATACLIGCGLGELADAVCPVVFENCSVPLLIDADGLNFLSRRPEYFDVLKAPAVLTPHAAEMSRLCGFSIDKIQSDRLNTALDFAARTGAVTVLKGAGTVTASPDGRAAINPTGNQGMAKGGSGDVLAGITGAFMAQGLSPFNAAAIGAFVHGRTGDVLIEKVGMRSMLPTDLIEGLPDTFKFLTQLRSLYSGQKV